MPMMPGRAPTVLFSTLLASVESIIDASFSYFPVCYRRQPIPLRLVFPIRYVIRGRSDLWLYNFLISLAQQSHTRLQVRINLLDISFNVYQNIIPQIINSICRTA